MLDPKLLRTQSIEIKENLKRRQDDHLLQLVDDFVEVDAIWRSVDKRVNSFRKSRNEYSKKIPKASGDNKKELILSVQMLKKDLEAAEIKLKQTTDRRQWILDRIPNLLHDSVPYGVDESDNQIIRTWGIPTEFDFEIKDHHELMIGLDFADIDRARKTSGARFYFLKNEAVLLELALLRYGIDILQQEGVTVFSTPTMVRKEMLYGTGFLPLGEEDIYKIEGEDLNLIGTSEVTLGGMHQGEVFTEDQLPIRYAGLSSCYRTEASATTKDDKGIFRVHEFKKVEMFTFTHPDKSWNEQDRMFGIAEKVFQGLELPYQVVNICTGDLGGIAARKFDIEVWMPGQQRFREVVSCSNCTDYQARRLKIRYREKEGSPILGYVHTLNSTTITTTRPMIAILENYQQPDGSIKIPKVLQKYTGFNIIEPKSG